MPRVKLQDIRTDLSSRQEGLGAFREPHLAEDPEIIPGLKEAFRKLSRRI